MRTPPASKLIKVYLNVSMYEYCNALWKLRTTCIALDKLLHPCNYDDGATQQQVDARWNRDIALYDWQPFHIDGANWWIQCNVNQY